MQEAVSDDMVNDDEPLKKEVHEKTGGTDLRRELYEIGQSWGISRLSIYFSSHEFLYFQGSENTEDSLQT